MHDVLCGIQTISLDQIRSLEKKNGTGSQVSLANQRSSFQVVAQSLDERRLLMGRYDPTSGVSVYVEIDADRAI